MGMDEWNFLGFVGVFGVDWERLFKLNVESCFIFDTECLSIYVDLFPVCLPVFTCAACRRVCLLCT